MPVTGGIAVVVIENEPAVPVVKVVLAAEVNAGSVRT